jgi:capsular exopolysaccharide synthesis family protein
VENNLSPYFIKRNSSPRNGVIELSSSMEVEGKGTNLREYWYLVKRYRWLIFGCAAAVVLSTMLYVFTRTPLYTAKATLLIERKAPQVLKIQDALAESIDNAEYYKTQYEILKSRALAERVIKEQGLENKAPFASQEGTSKPGLFSGLFNAITNWRRQSSQPAKKPDEPQLTVKPQIVGAYLGMLSVQPVRGTGLVQVAFQTPSPALSAQLANGHATSYIRYGLDLRSKTNEEALAFLEKKLLELKERVESSEVALNTYRRDKGIISLSDKENIVVDRLGDLNKRLTEAEADRIGLEAKVRTVRGGNYDAIAGMVNDPLVENLKKEMARLEGEQVQLAKEFKPGYPPLDKITAQLENARNRLRAELRDAVKGVESAYQAARVREAELRAAMQDQKTATLNLKDSAVQYTILAREVDTNKQLYDSVLQRMREMRVAADSQSTNIYVVDKAELPRLTSYPNKRRSLLIALFFGLVGGVGLAFLLDHLNSTFRTPEELERYIHLPNLAIVPDFMCLNGNGRTYSYGYGPRRLTSRKKEENGNLPAKKAPSEIITEQDPFSVVAESYRNLRSALLLAKADEPPKTILLTSATRGEGKSTTLVNTAIVFAQMGARVLIMDGDLRRPRCHRILKMPNEVGLAECLAGQIEPEKVFRPTQVDNLFVITSGSRPPNPAELLGSKTMARTLDALCAQFDYIFLDSSPVLPVSDALPMATMVDGVLMVVDGQKTPRQLVRDARVRLTSPQIKMLGVLLNRVDVQEGTYGSYYGHYYNYYKHDEAEPA